MPLKAYGVVGSLDTIHFNQIIEDVGEASAGMAVMDGLAVTAVSGLTVSVAPGRSLQCGTNVFNDAALQKTLAARSTGNRIDRVVMQVDLSKGLDTAATVEVVQGRAVATGTPVAPQLIQDILVSHKWQTPLAQILVPPSGAITITDDRPAISTDLPFAACTVQGGWIQGSPQLGVIRAGDVVELAGRIQLTGGAQNVGDAAFFGSAPVIPVGYRPRRSAAVAMATSDNQAAMSLHRLLILGDGTVTCNTLLGTLPTGGSLRVQTTHWLGA